MQNVQVYIKSVACGLSLIIKILHTTEYWERDLNMLSVLNAVPYTLQHQHLCCKELGEELVLFNWNSKMSTQSHKKCINPIQSLKQT